MKTTVEIPDDLLREIKLRAARDDRELEDVLVELLRQGLAATARGHSALGRRVQFPVIRGGHPAAAGEELTPIRVAEILTEQDAEWSG